MQGLWVCIQKKLNFRINGRFFRNLGCLINKRSPKRNKQQVLNFYMPKITYIVQSFLVFAGKSFFEGRRLWLDLAGFGSYAPLVFRLFVVSLQVVKRSGFGLWLKILPNLWWGSWPGAVCLHNTSSFACCWSRGLNGIMTSGKWYGL